VADEGGMLKTSSLIALEPSPRIRGIRKKLGQAGYPNASRCVHARPDVTLLAWQLRR
jgi:hypothetical protein